MNTKIDVGPADAELLHEARNAPDESRRRAAASRLLERYQDRVYIWCFRMVREHERACDLAQEVLLSAYRKLGTFEGRSEFSSWLFVITRNRCLSALRRPSILAEEADGSEPVDPSPGPEQRLLDNLDEDALLDLLRTHLDPVERDVLWLRCLERVPVDEITRLLQLDSASGARGLLQRARRKLRVALAAREVKGP